MNSDTQGSSRYPAQSLEDRHAAALRLQRELQIMELERSNAERVRYLRLANQPVRLYIYENGPILVQLVLWMLCGAGLAAAVSILM